MQGLKAVDADRKHLRRESYAVGEVVFGRSKSRSPFVRTESSEHERQYLRCESDIVTGMRFFVDRQPLPPDKSAAMVEGNIRSKHYRPIFGGNGEWERVEGGFDHIRFEASLPDAPIASASISSASEAVCW